MLRRGVLQCLLSARGSRLRCPARAVWSAADTLHRSVDAAEFTAIAAAECRRDADWTIDFAALEADNGARSRGGGAILPHLLAALSPNSSGGTGGGLGPSPRTLAVTLSSPASFELARALGDWYGGALHELRVRLDVAPAAAPSDSDSPSAAWGESASPADAAAGLFDAVRRSRAAAGYAAPLEMLEVVHIDGDVASATYVGDRLVASLAELLEDPLSTPTLRALSLRHMNGQRCSPAVLARLARAVSATVCVERLDLHGTPQVAQHLLQSRALRRLVGLQQLDLGGCELGDAWVGPLLAELEEAVGGWLRLQTLRLSHCGVTQYGLEQLLAAMRRAGEDATASVEVLDLSANGLDDAAALVAATLLVRCHALRELDLRHNRITRRSAEFLLSSLAHATELRRLSLRANRLGNDAAAHLAAWAKCWPALEELDLTRCRLAGPPALRSLAAVLAHTASLRELRLAGNDLQPGAGGGDSDAVADAPLKLFAYDPSYTKGDGEGKVPTSFELDRRDRETGRRRFRGTEAFHEEEAGQPQEPLEDAYTAFGRALGGCRGLRVLDMADCCLTDAAFVSIATQAAPAVLEELRLGGNPLFLSPGAVEALVRLLWCCAGSLTVLDAGFTGLGDWGVSTLCDGPVDGAEGGVVPQMAALRRLLLSHARVGPIGVEALAAAAGSLPALQVLALDGNQCRDTAAESSDDEGEAERCVALLSALHRPSPQPLRLVTLSGSLTTAAKCAVWASPERHQLSQQGVQIIM